MSSADPGLYPGELLAIPGSGGVFVAGDSEISPRLVHFTSTADVMLLSENVSAHVREMLLKRAFSWACLTLAYSCLHRRPFCWQMLLKGAHDNVIITLLKPIET